MDRARAPWPVAVEAMGSAAGGAVVWRKQGRSFVTLIAKATYRLVPEGVLASAPPQPVLMTELHHDDDPRRSLRAASDLAPYLRRVDVLLTGHACAPPTGPVQSGGVRLTMYRDEHCVLDKALMVQGDRAQDPSGRWFGVVPFQRLPLVYERATGSAEINPVGVDARYREPNVVHPRGWGLPACFGPVSRHWPSRRRHVAAFDPRAFEPPWLTLPDPLDDRYFQAAPDDQQLDNLRGDEWIVLEGMHPSTPRLRTRLPGARAVARVRGEVPGSTRSLELRADMLSIDMDRELCTLTFRAYLPLASEQILPALRVLVEVENTGAIKPQIAAAPVAPAPAQKSVPPAASPGETAFAPSDLHAGEKPVMPFAPVTSAPSPALARSSPSLDRSAAPAPKIKQDLGSTIASTGAEAPSAPVVMPFAPVTSPAASPFATPSATRAAPPIHEPSGTLFVPSDLPRARAATPFEGVVMPPPRPRPIEPASFDAAPESAAPMTLPLPEMHAPLPFVVSPSPPAPPPLLISAPPIPADAGAPPESLGASFLAALPVPPAAPRKRGRRRRDESEAPAPRAR